MNLFHDFLKENPIVCIIQIQAVELHLPLEIELSLFEVIWVAFSFTHVKITHKTLFYSFGDDAGSTDKCKISEKI